MSDGGGEPVFASGLHYQPIGFVDAETPTAPGAVGHIGDFDSILAATGVEVVVLAGHLTDEQFGDVVDASLTAGCQVLSMPRDVGAGPVNPATVWRSGQPLVELTAPTLRGGQLLVKRGFDVIGATVGLILVTPVLLVVAALVKSDSPGPVFFRQNRVGRGGRLFKIFKFRTMVARAEEHRDELFEKSIYPDRRLFKVVGDPRITRLGAWLRRTSLDELPQLFNVLKGEMSLVGPRPPIPSEVELYEAHHYARFDVKPGITGPWQINGRNELTDFEKVVALETHYIREWSLLGDIGILFEDGCSRASDAWGDLTFGSSAKAILQSCEREKGGARQETALSEVRVRPAEKQRDATKHQIKRLRFVRQDVDF